MIDIPELGDIPGSTYAVIGISALALLAYRRHANSGSLNQIPTVGYSWPILSYWSAIRFLFDGKAMLEEGYSKYKGGLFKIPMTDNWTIVLTSPQLIDEARQAPDEQLSFMAAADLSIQNEYTIGESNMSNPYHINIIKSQLRRNLGDMFGDLRDEIAHSFEDTIPTNGHEWVKVPIYEAILDIVCRSSNRTFVGLPLCRDPDYMELNINFTMDVVKAGFMINRFPNFLKPIAGRMFSKLPSHLERAGKHLRPLIEERRKMVEELGDDWTDKPNDFLMWLMEAAQGEERTVPNLARRILSTNFAAIHTSSISFTHALYRLADNPQCVPEMREEIEAVVAADGWTKIAMGKMNKLDSFLRECQRMDGIGLLVMGRYVFKPFTFSNGITIPKGCVIECASGAIHYDDEYHADAGVFDPFRWSKMRENEGEKTKHQMVSTEFEYLPFGHGRHACPGRFFAANELKAMLAHVLMEYDVKLEGAFPKSMNVGSSVIPAKANVFFRKRQMV